VFHHHYYDVVTRVKCSLSRSDGDSNRFLTSWWFIPHTNHTHPLKWATDHQWHYLGKYRRTNWSRSTQGPPDSQDALWAHSSRFRHTPCSTNTRVRVNPGPNNAISFAVERYFIRPAKYEACIQHDKRDEQRSVLNRHRQKTNSTLELCLVASNFSVQSPIIHQHMVIFRISSILYLKYSSNTYNCRWPKITDRYRSKQG
jgi:hypothetical protein